MNIADLHRHIPNIDWSAYPGLSLGLLHLLEPNRIPQELKVQCWEWSRASRRIRPSGARAQATVQVWLFSQLFGPPATYLRRTCSNDKCVSPFHHKPTKQQDSATTAPPSSVVELVGSPSPGEPTTPIPIVKEIMSEIENLIFVRNVTGKQAIIDDLLQDFERHHIDAAFAATASNIINLLT